MASRDKQSREGTTFNYRSATFCELVLHHSPLLSPHLLVTLLPFFFPPSRVIVISKEDSITKILLCNIYAVWWSRGLHLPSPLGDFCYLLLSYTLVVFCLILLFLTIFSIPNSISLFPIVWTNDSNALTKEIASKGNFNFYQPRYFNSPELEWFLSSLVWVLISLAANLGWPFFQFDVKNACLHGDLQEEVYMEQPSGFVAQGERNQVCHLRKAALYGLKQSPRARFGKFNDTVLRFGMHRSQSGIILNSHSHRTEGKVLSIFYVDNIIITDDDQRGIYELKTYLHQQLHTKDLGKLWYF